ncbi:hypothetical protein ABVK25_000645 [Lepraria finkii]|uniref:Uncharacterized protein n=1 Tax=Lepraria finkii TaxID=1340010 RepID=A0ABR4BNH1_9LECA
MNSSDSLQPDRPYTSYQPSKEEAIMNTAIRQYSTDQITAQNTILDRVEAMICKWHADMMAGFDRLLEKIDGTGPFYERERGG